MYHLPLLPGYGPSANVRSSAAPTHQEPDVIVPISEAEDTVNLISLPASPALGIANEAVLSPPVGADVPHEVFTPVIQETPSIGHHDTEEDLPQRFAEAIFFSYGVVVFFGLEEGQERAILEDVQNAGVMRRPLEEDRWEVEECHYAVSHCPPDSLSLTDVSLV